MPQEKPMQNPPMPPHEPREPHPEDLRNDKPCHCCDKCKCRHKGAKLVAALIIFLAGFGAAMMCRCMKHSSMDYPHHCAMMKKHAMMTPNYTDGAGNVIIINTDGSKPMMHHKPYKPKQKSQPTAMVPTASPQAMPIMPTVEDEDFE